MAVDSLPSPGRVGSLVEVSTHFKVSTCSGILSVHKSGIWPIVALIFQVWHVLCFRLSAKELCTTDQTDYMHKHYT